MKSFSQFLNESCLQEEEARQGSLFTRSGKPQDFKNPKKVPFTATDPTPTPASRRLPAAAPDAPKIPSGQLEIPEPRSTKVSGSQFRNAGEARQGSLFTKSGKPQNFTGGRTPFVGTEPVKATKRLPSAAPEAPKASPGQQVIRQTSNPPSKPALPPSPSGGPLATRGTNPQAPPEAMMRGAYDRASAPRTSPGGSGGSGGKPPALPAAGQTSTPKPSVGKPPIGKPPSTKIPGIKSGGVISAALGAADEKMKGSGWARSLAKGATVGAGAILGGLAGGAAGTAVAPGAGTAIGGFAGQAAGAAAAEKAFDTVAGANAKERAAMATANRQRQAGTAIKGIGGKTSFDTKKNTMTTGTGSQRKTVGLAKTGVVQRGAQSVAGHLAYKGGKAVYKAGPSAQSLAKTSSNPLERVGRTLFAGAYKKHDTAKAQQALTKARQSDAARQKALGVKALPGK